MSTFHFRGNKIGNWKRKSNKHLTKLKKKSKNKDLHAERNNLWLIFSPKNKAMIDNVLNMVKW